MYQIRTKSIQAIGSLVLQYKSKFLENSYLKYIGWALYDKVTAPSPHKVVSRIPFRTSSSNVRGPHFEGLQPQFLVSEVQGGSWFGCKQHQDVRSAALSAIGNMYEDGLANELEMFTSRFKDRVLQMRLDKDKSVSVTAVETALSMAQKELLDAEQIEVRARRLLLSSSPLLSTPQCIRDRGVRVVR